MSDTEDCVGKTSIGIFSGRDGVERLGLFRRKLQRKTRCIIIEKQSRTPKIMGRILNNVGRRGVVHDASLG